MRPTFNAFWPLQFVLQMFFNAMLAVTNAINAFSRLICVMVSTDAKLDRIHSSTSFLAIISGWFCDVLINLWTVFCWSFLGRRDFERSNRFSVSRSEERTCETAHPDIRNFVAILFSAHFRGHNPDLEFDVTSFGKFNL